MRALSLTQPWAEAIVRGLKHWETRSWPTNYRGEIAIHAAKHVPGWVRGYFQRGEMDLSTLPLGCIVALCDLTECRQTKELRGSLSLAELSWGDYEPGRYAFKLENVRVLSKPVAVRGSLSIWTVPVDVAARVFTFEVAK